MRFQKTLSLAVCFLFGWLPASFAFSRPISFEERVAAQRRIEEVYWSHRTWPKENRLPKPPLDRVVPAAAIRAKVEDYLRKSAALEKYWHEPVGAAELQAELVRMAKQTGNPRMLRELFAALGNDPEQIAETLVRQTLANRLLQDRYATTSWKKQPFGIWWESQRAALRAEIAQPRGSYTLPEIPETTCVEGSWRPTNLLGAPGARNRHTAVYTGSEMIVWGGYGGTRLNTGGRYDPATDSWLATSTGTGVPSGRYGHTAVWTGTEMLVWGGSSAVNPYLQSGGRYDPASDSWLEISVTDAPSGRYSHSAVWTGSEMILWGGVDGAGGGTGGRYRPATDSWLPTSEVNAPVGRSGHTAVWTGNEMIVWGGLDNTGGRYNPVTDEWIATSIGTDVPSGRSNHTAVWTGSEMIVWGGGVDTGGRYLPGGNSWRPTSTGPDTPSPRSIHTAVWTGTEMIVWGGVSSGFLDSGARYDPLTDGWSPTSTGSGVPSPRFLHTAVWTGNEMIVWGGGPGNYSDTGGRYCVSSCDAPATWYRDADLDDFGVCTDTVLACALPPGYAAVCGDCNDIDRGAWLPPHEVSSLTVSKEGSSVVRVAWDSQAEDVGWFTAYDTISASLGNLRSTGAYGGPIYCLRGGDPTNWWDDDRSGPDPGQAWYYLVRAVDSCGAGTYGDASISPDPRDALDESSPCP